MLFTVQSSEPFWPEPPKDENTDPLPPLQADPGATFERTGKTETVSGVEWVQVDRLQIELPPPRGWIKSNNLSNLEDFTPTALEPTDGAALGELCLDSSLQHGTDFHFLLSWAHFESQFSNAITDTGSGKRIGPFGFSRHEWNERRKTPSYGIDFSSLDIFDPSYQTELAATKLHQTIAAYELANDGKAPEAAQLLLALSIGVPAAVAAGKGDQEASIAEVILKASEAADEPVAERDRILAFYADRLLDGGSPGKVSAVFQVIADKLEASLAEAKTVIEQLSAEFGEELIPSVSTSLPSGTDLMVMARNEGHLARIRGHLVEKLQNALVAKGHAEETDSDGKKFADGDFGDKTEAALNAWQEASGKPKTSRIDSDIWNALTGEQPPSFFQRCAQMTSQFEGHGFDSTLAGGSVLKEDHHGNVKLRDKGGITWGFMGFTWTYLHIQRIIEIVEAKDPGILTDAFGAAKADLLRGQLGVTDASQARSWAEGNLQDKTKHQHPVKADWANGFKKFGAKTEVREAQVEHAHSLWKQCMSKVTHLEFSELRTLGLCFDLFINAGPGKLSSAISGLISGGDESAARKVIDEKTRGHTWRDARNRAFVDGAAQVNRSNYDLRYWGLMPFEDEDSKPVDVDAPTQPGDSADFDTYLRSQVDLGGFFEPREFLARGGSATGNDNPMPPPRKLWPNVVPLAKLLVRIRSELGVGVRLNSVYRAPAYNSKIGGARRSQHKMFKAADFSVVGGGAGGPKAWAKKVRSLRNAGVFSGGIGTYNTFVHVDVRGYNATW